MASLRALSVAVLSAMISLGFAVSPTVQALQEQDAGDAPAPAQIEFPDRVSTGLVNERAGSGLCMDLSANNQVVIFNPCDQSIRQKWIIEKQVGELSTIKNAGAGDNLCLFSSVDASIVNMTACNSENYTSHVYWTRILRPSGMYSLVSKVQNDYGRPGELALRADNSLTVTDPEAASGTWSWQLNGRLPDGVASTPIFADEFEGDQLDDTKWRHRLPGIRNNCKNVPETVSVRAGYLTIKTYSGLSNGILQNYCGMISTADTFLANQGYWEASVRFKRAFGVQVAFWVQTPAMEVGKPEQGVEIDVFEHGSAAESKNYNHAIHWDLYGEHHKYWAWAGLLDNLDDGKFHRFGVLWAKDRYEFYVDGVMTKTVPSSVAPISLGDEFIILSSEVPRQFPPEGFGDQYSAQTDFDVDYVRVYPLSD
ncbi:hypothetical protein ALQ47_03290 [Pseudomonas cichorii]|nr:hypothetical protein ALQ47_03290 [Pseudomonas cichorii]